MIHLYLNLRQKKLDPSKYLSSGQFSLNKHGRSKSSIVKSN